MLQEQVLYDLNIFSHNKQKRCLFDMLNHCKTEGGKNALKDLCGFKNITREIMQNRQDAVKHISTNVQTWQMTITTGEIYYMEQYLNSSYGFITYSNSVQRSLHSFGKLFTDKSQYYFVLSGIKQLLDILSKIKRLYTEAYAQTMPVLLKTHLKAMQEGIEKLGIHDDIFETFRNGEPSPVLLYGTDEKLRRERKELIGAILINYYETEALLSLATAHNAMQLVFPDIAPAGSALTITDLRHPMVEQCVANSINPGTKNLLIVTGPNMAGKSTFLKSLGLAFFMTGLGIGVAASKASIPYTSQIITSINTEDDINAGVSYFLSEVNNIKKIASGIKDVPALVIADELFKGTNIKDAIACSEVVLNGFLKRRDSLFIVSTHLYELATQFEHNEFCLPVYFDGRITEKEVKFDHLLKKGISDQRLGTYLMQQHNIPELLEC